MSPPSIWNLVALNPFPDVQCWIQIVCRFLNKKGTFISLHHLHSSWSLNFVCGGREGNVSVAGLCKRDIYFAPTGLNIRPETVASLSVASDLCVLSQNNLTSGVPNVCWFLCVETISLRFEFLCRESTRFSDQRTEYHIGKAFPWLRVFAFAGLYLNSNWNYRTHMHIYFTSCIIINIQIYMTIKYAGFMSLHICYKVWQMQDVFIAQFVSWIE